MEIRLRLVYADGDAVAALLRPRRWSYAFFAILIPFFIKSTVELFYVQLNKMSILKDINRIAVVANVNHRLIISDDEGQA